MIAVVENPMFNNLLYTDMKMIIESEESNKEVIIDGVYPCDALTVQMVSDDNQTDFMDVTLLLHPTTSKEHPLYKCWITKAYDTRKSQKYKGIKFIKYPSANSLNPDSILF